MRLEKCFSNKWAGWGREKKGKRKGKRRGEEGERKGRGREEEGERKGRGKGKEEEEEGESVMFLKQSQYDQCVAASLLLSHQEETLTCFITAFNLFPLTETDFCQLQIHLLFYEQAFSN